MQDPEKMLERIGYLCNLQVDSLRATYCISQGITTTNVSEDRQQTKNMTRGEMVKIIISNEFVYKESNV
jgi:hypothetical protein